MHKPECVAITVVEAYSYDHWCMHVLTKVTLDRLPGHLHWMSICYLLCIPHTIGWLDQTWCWYEDLWWLVCQCIWSIYCCMSASIVTCTRVHGADWLHCNCACCQLDWLCVNHYLTVSIMVYTTWSWFSTDYTTSTLYKSISVGSYMQFGFELMYVKNPCISVIYFKCACMLCQLFSIQLWWYFRQVCNSYTQSKYWLFFKPSRHFYIIWNDL